jgi:hypothetical protein
MFNMVTYGKGGWDYHTLYSMPIYLRNFHFNELKKALEAEANPNASGEAKRKHYAPPEVRGPR